MVDEMARGDRRLRGYCTEGVIRRRVYPTRRTKEDPRIPQGFKARKRFNLDRLKYSGRRRILPTREGAPATDRGG